MALLHHYKKSVRPFKCGPDFIDPQFHQKIAATPSVNLDGYMMDKKQLQWLFAQYFDKDVAIVEGAMGYYDGLDKQASAYDVAKTLGIASLLVLDGSGSYITIAAVLKGIQSFREDHTIKAVVLNKISSPSHYELIKKHIEAECEGVVVCGWIKKDLPSLGATHLGLDLQELDSLVLEQVANDVLEHIEIEKLESVMTCRIKKPHRYPFVKLAQKDATCVVVYDANFSFLYHDNLEFLQEIYKEVVIINATKDEAVPSKADMVILPGGYVETAYHYEKIKDANTFKNSLIQHAKTKKVYGECAGMIYLGEFCDDKQMSGILPLTFTLTERRQRLGYYQCDIGGKTIKGHAFHYTKITKAPPSDIKLYKASKKGAKEGGYRQNNIFATYLHTMWRVYPTVLD